MRTIITAAAAAILLASQSTALASEPAPALIYKPDPGEELDAETLANINNFLIALTPQQGDVALKGAEATINIPSTHYFLDSEDAQSILVDAWGNPPDPEILGMIFPAGSTPLNVGSWGATVYFSDDGYVSDEDAHKIDYDDMMKDLKKGQKRNNKWREENGYEPVDIIGWAETPFYNDETKKMFWAKELKFGEAELNTLNYDIRVLGRKGTLVISFIATMNELPDIRDDAPAVLEMAHFNPGATYADYQPGVDKKAAYGIAGLVGGGLLLKKTGLLAGLLLFGKKFIVIILAGLVAAFGAVKRFFMHKGQDTNT